MVVDCGSVVDSQCGSMSGCQPWVSGWWSTVRLRLVVDCGSAVGG